jgi:hypothetical protein
LRKGLLRPNGFWQSGAGWVYFSGFEGKLAVSWRRSGKVSSEDLTANQVDFVIPALEREESELS